MQTYPLIGTHTLLAALCPGLPGWASTRKVKPIWILLKQETLSGSGISWAIFNPATYSRQITMPAPHHLVFYRPGALPPTQPTASKYWKQMCPQMWSYVIYDYQMLATAITLIDLTAVVLYFCLCRECSWLKISDNNSAREDVSSL